MSFVNKKPKMPSNLSVFQTELNSLFDNFFSPTTWPHLQNDLQTFANWSPSLDVSETDEAYTVCIELPGISQDDIDITFQDNALTIKGEKKLEREEDKDSYKYIERSYGSFSRSIPFTTQIEEEKISAECKNGVLKVVLAKKGEVINKTRKINIK